MASFVDEDQFIARYFATPAPPCWVVERLGGALDGEVLIKVVKSQSGQPITAFSKEALKKYWSEDLNRLCAWVIKLVENMEADPRRTIPITWSLVGGGQEVQ